MNCTINPKSTDPSFHFGNHFAGSCSCYWVQSWVLAESTCSFSHNLKIFWQIIIKVMFESALRTFNFVAFLSIFDKISPSNLYFKAFKTFYIHLRILWVKYDEIVPRYLISKTLKYLTWDLCPSNSEYFL